MANCAQKLCMYTKIYHHGPEAILSDEQLALILGVDSSLIRSWPKRRIELKATATESFTLNGVKLSVLSVRTYRRKTMSLVLEINNQVFLNATASREAFSINPP